MHKLITVGWAKSAWKGPIAHVTTLHAHSAAIHITQLPVSYQAQALVPPQDGEDHLISEIYTAKSFTSTKKSKV